MIKKNRIRKNEEFSRIIAKKHSIASASFVLYFDAKKEDHSRVGLSVSKKIGDAVTRNKIKRQIRMMLANFYEFDNEPNDLIIIVRNRFLLKTFAENSFELENLIKKAII